MESATAASRRRQRVALTDRARVGAALVRASQWIKRRNATLAITPWLAALAWRRDARAPALPRTGFR